MGLARPDGLTVPESPDTPSLQPGRRYRLLPPVDLAEAYLGRGEHDEGPFKLAKPRAQVSGLFAKAFLVDVPENEEAVPALPALV